MEKHFLSIQEAAKLVGKSPQTIRRMIKRGDLSAQRVKSPQGFHYVVPLDDLGTDEEMLHNSIVENPVSSLKLEAEPVLTNQNTIPTSQQAMKPHTAIENGAIDRNVQNFLQREHEEKMALIAILEIMQEKMDRLERRPRSLLGHIVDWWFGMK